MEEDNDENENGDLLPAASVSSSDAAYTDDDSDIEVIDFD